MFGDFIFSLFARKTYTDLDKSDRLVIKAKCLTFRSTAFKHVKPKFTFTNIFDQLETISSGSGITVPGFIVFVYGYHVTH